MKTEIEIMQELDRARALVEKSKKLGDKATEAVGRSYVSALCWILEKPQE